MISDGAARRPYPNAFVPPTVSLREPMKVFDSLPVGARVRLKMRAMNETGHGPFGEEAAIVVS